MSSRGGRSEGERSRQLPPQFTITIVAGLGMLAVFAFQGDYPALIGPFTNIVTPLLAGLATLAAVNSGRRYRFLERDEFGRVWLLFTVGMGTWFVAELTWSVYALFLNVPVPYPSVADIFYAGGYVPFLAGLLLYLKTCNYVVKLSDLVFSFAVAALLAVPIAAFVLTPLLRSSTPSLAWFLDVLYPALDALLVAAATVGFLTFLGGNVGDSWMILALAIYMVSVGDVTFGYLSANGAYYTGSVSDLFYVWGYMLYALSFYVHSKEL